jgi:hypothetical protein
VPLQMDKLSMEPPDASGEQRRPERTLPLRRV